MAVTSPPSTTAPPSTRSSQKSTSSSSQNAFQTLKDKITTVLGPSSGLTSEDVDASYLQKLMEEYISKDEEWREYAFEDRSRGYTRNLVDEGNGKSNLLILVWTPGKGSPIHDHADAHCLMKVLSGTLVETRYAAPSALQPPKSTSPKTLSSIDGNAAKIPSQRPPNPSNGTTLSRVQEGDTPHALKIIKESTYVRNQVAYMSDDLGLHRISNPSTTGELAVSLHLYTPPNAAREGCNIFDPKTGKSSHVTQSNYYSVFGVKT